MQALNPAKAKRPDGISPKIFRETEKYVVKPLAYIPNKICENGIYPRLNRATVIPNLCLEIN